MKSVNKKRKVERPVFMIPLIVYMIGIIIGGLNSSVDIINDLEALQYVKNEHIARCVIYFMMWFTVSYCPFGVPVIWYTFYLYGVNNGVITVYLLKYINWNPEVIFTIFIFAVLSVMSVFLIGVATLSVSGEIFRLLLNRKRYFGFKKYVAWFVLLLSGVVLFYVSDICKFRLLESIK